MDILARAKQQKKVNRAKFDNIYVKNPGISWILDDEAYILHSVIALLIVIAIFIRVISLQHLQ